MGSNAPKAIEKGLLAGGHIRRRLESHPDDDPTIRHKELRRLVWQASFGAGSDELSRDVAPFAL